MRTLKTLSNRKLDELQERLEQRLRNHAYSWLRKDARKKLVKIAGERLRRIGL